MAPATPSNVDHAVPGDVGITHQTGTHSQGTPISHGAAIALGVVAGLLLIFIILVAVYIQRRPQRRAAAAPELEVNEEGIKVEMGQQQQQRRSAESARTLVPGEGEQNR